MKGFLQEYGIIMVVVAVVLGMLAFGKTGYAKGIQDAILGSANHIVDTGENITKGSEVKASDIIEIEGSKYIVIKRNESDQLLVMAVSNIKKNSFQSEYRSDELSWSTYENSTIDKYLENEWYNSLSSTMKAAIQKSNIKQASYATLNDPDSKQETGYNGQVYNTISRHVFLPSVDEIGDIVDLNDENKVNRFVSNPNTDIWTRDSYQKEEHEVISISSFYSNGKLFGGFIYTSAQYVVGRSIYMRPAFIIDLSKVDYKVTGHVDYK